MPDSDGNRSTPRGPFDRTIDDPFLIELYRRRASQLTYNDTILLFSGHFIILEREG